MTKTTKDAYRNICIVYNINVEDIRPKQTSKLYGTGNLDMDEKEIERGQNELVMVMHDRYVDW